jgi:hypothetical protein
MIDPTAPRSAPIRATFIATGALKLYKQIQQVEPQERARIRFILPLYGDAANIPSRAPYGSFLTV